MKSSLWTICTIKDFLDRGEVEIKTGPFGTQLHASDYVNEGTPVINVRNIGFGEIRSKKLEFISTETVQRLSSHLLETNDIVFGRKGAVERHVLIRPEYANWFQGSDCLRVRFKSESVDPRFLSYYFLTENHKQWMINHCSHGATMASLNQDIICRISLRLPPVIIQRKIAATLGAYDDLIENNTRRIKILEEMAQTLYREWFVEFRFPGHEKVKMVDSELGMVPEGWEVDCLKDHITLDKGISYKGKFLTDNGLPMVNLKCILPNGGFKREGTKPYSGDYKLKHTTKPGDLVIANTDLTQAGNVIGSPAIVPNIQTDGDILISHHLYAIRFIYNTQITKYFLYNLMLTHDFKSFAKGRANGTTVLGLAQDGVLDFSFAKPPKRLLSQFEILIDSIYEVIEIYERKNINLRRTRDMLLPKLISGELDVENIEVQMPNGVENEQ